MKYLEVVGSNQTEINKNGIKFLFSYNTPVAALTTEGGLVSTKKYSNTTSRHISAAIKRWGVDRIDVDQAVIDEMFK